MATVALAGSLSTTRHPHELACYVGPARRPSAAVYRRRRLVVAVAASALIAAALLAAGPTVAAFGNDPASVPERRPATGVHVAEPGDTLWSIARLLQPTGDVRPLVTTLQRLNGGAGLAVGQEVRLP